MTEQTTEATETKPENPRAWMQELCEWHSMAINKPFPIETERGSFDVATNGHGILFLPGATFPVHPEAPPVESVAKFLTTPPVRLGQVARMDLLAWAKAVSGYFCPNCNAAGVSVREPIPFQFRVSELFGRPVDRWLVWQFLNHHHLDTAEIEVFAHAEPETPIHFLPAIDTPFDVQWWRAVLMPCRSGAVHSYRLGEPFPLPAEAAE